MTSESDEKDIFYFGIQRLAFTLPVVFSPIITTNSSENKPKAKERSSKAW